MFIYVECVCMHVDVGVKVTVRCSNPHWYYSADAGSYFWTSHCYADPSSTWNDSCFLSLAGLSYQSALQFFIKSIYTLN